MLVLCGTLAAQGWSVKSSQKISETQGGFGGNLDTQDHFGWSVTSLGDLDGDGVSEIAVGALSDDDGGSPGSNRGAVWILWLNLDGTVRAEQKISATEGGFADPLDPQASLGSAVAGLGDLDGDGIPDLAVGASEDRDGGGIHDYPVGAVWILFLNTDGTVRSQQKISATAGGFGAGLDEFDRFGGSIAPLGDLDGDGIVDLAVGAPSTFVGGVVWILFLNRDGTVRAKQEVGESIGGFPGDLDQQDYFGNAAVGVGDVDGDGHVDLAVGARGDDDNGLDRGAVWVLLLNPDGTVRSGQKHVAPVRGFFRRLLEPSGGPGWRRAVGHRRGLAGRGTRLALDPAAE